MTHRAQYWAGTGRPLTLEASYSGKVPWYRRPFIVASGIAIAGLAAIGLYLAGG